MSAPPIPPPNGLPAVGSLPPAALAELRQVYDALDQHLAALGVECRACGRCCDFARNDYVLYASFIERAAARDCGGAARLAEAGQCGFLAGGRCTLRAWRPLGCRVFFCAPEHKAREQEICEEFLGRLRAATDRCGLPWDYRPFFENQATVEAAVKTRSSRSV